MSEENRNRDDAIREDTNREETPGRQKISREDETQNKGTVDKLIDKAHEKGVFDKAAKFAKDSQIRKGQIRRGSKRR